MIVVDARLFVWRFVDGWPTGGFHAYSSAHKTSPLHIAFPMNSSGTPFVREDQSLTRGINLHTPVWAAALIAYALRQGWEPERLRSPFVIGDGAAVLAALDFEPAARVGA